MPVQVKDTSAEEIQQQQAIRQIRTVYNQLILERAVAIIKAKDSLNFDPQGRVLVDVPVKQDIFDEIADKLPQNSILTANQNFRTEIFVNKDLQRLIGINPHVPVICSVDINPAPPLKPTWDTEQRVFTKFYESALRGVTQEILAAYLNMANKGSVIALQQEMEMQVRLAARVLQKSLGGKDPQQEKWDEINNKVFAQVNTLVMRDFTNALTKSYDANTNTINVEKLNDTLDQARKKIAGQAKKMLTAEARKNFIFSSKTISGITTHLAETTPVTEGDCLHTDSARGLVTFIGGNKVTSHVKKLGEKNMADRQVEELHYDIDHRNNFNFKALTEDSLTIRSDSLAPGNPFDLTAIYDISDKLQEYKEKYHPQVPGKGHFTYNLLTALNSPYNPIDRADEGKNKQRISADRILKGAHVYNYAQYERRGQDKPFYCYVQNISVNGFGQTLGYDGLFKTDTTKEATLMSEIALLNTLVGDNQQYKARLDVIMMSYQAFLQDNYAPSKHNIAYFFNSPQGAYVQMLISEIKEGLKKAPLSLIENGDIRSLAKAALAQLFAKNAHFNHANAKLMQTLSVLVEDASLVTCKSGNERTNSIISRVSQLRGENNAADLQALTDALREAASLGANQTNFSQLSNTIDRIYDDNGLQGAFSLVSNTDQGITAKVEDISKKPWYQFWPDTNYAEKNLPKLAQSKVGSLQSTKSLAGDLKDELTGRFRLSRNGKIALAATLIVIGILLSIIPPVGLAFGVAGAAIASTTSAVGIGSIGATGVATTIVPAILGALAAAAISVRNTVVAWFRSRENVKLATAEQNSDVDQSVLDHDVLIIDGSSVSPAASNKLSSQAQALHLINKAHGSNHTDTAPQVNSVVAEGPAEPIAPLSSSPAPVHPVQVSSTTDSNHLKAKYQSLMSDKTEGEDHADEATAQNISNFHGS